MSYLRARWWSVGVLLLVSAVAPAAVACGGSSGSGDAGASPQATAPVTSSSASPLATADTQAIRDLMAAYWTAYNAYDADKALSYLDESYRTSQDKTVRSEIGQIKTFGVKLGVTEKSAPAATGTDQAVMYIDMSTPTGGRELIMKFKRSGTGWTITFIKEL